MNKKIENEFCQCLGSDNVNVYEPMNPNTTFRIGGPAEYYLRPHSVDELRKILHICKRENLPFFILGNGSNLLVSDKGYQGVVIQLWKNMSDIEVDAHVIRAKAGALLSKIAVVALDNSLAGFAFASGIPGTLGGAVVMNAGAYGGEMKDVLEEVTVMDAEGNVICLKRDELNLGYRTSIVKEKGYIVLEAVIRLKKGEASHIKEQMDDFKERRTSKQPFPVLACGQCQTCRGTVRATHCHAFGRLGDGLPSLDGAVYGVCGACGLFQAIFIPLRHRQHG